MEIDLIFKIAGIGIIISILNQVLSKAEKAEYATVITIAGIIIVFIMILPHIQQLFDEVRNILEF